MNILQRNKTEPRVPNNRTFKISMIQEKIILHMKKCENMTQSWKETINENWPQDYLDAGISHTKKDDCKAIIIILKELKKNIFSMSERIGKLRKVI